MNTFKSAIKTLEKKIAVNSQIALSKSIKDVKSVKIGGSIFALDTKALFKLGKSTYFGNVYDNWQGKPTIVMTLGMPHEDAFIVGASYSLVNKSGGDENDNTTGVVTDFKVLESNDESIKVLLFQDGYEYEDNTEMSDGKYSFTGTFTLENGDTLSFSVSNLYLGEHVSSRFQGRFGVNNADGSNVEEVPLYGVSKLGIAEFRRVEQEVSCYVPGEVSHIENIMAKEYKEKFKRRFRSTNTFSERERVSEKEREKELNTSTSSDLQTEASKIASENHSAAYGANASVSGEASYFGNKGSFSIGSSANVSNSTSATESNSMAQSYAQEVTERALERVTSKVTEKRSERIVHEYEEHSKHGFDNTQGDSNFKGVYRWVDKIYKNNLVNYGKRLMYEFAIPEPARFFKEAILKKIEDKTDAISNLILPTPPPTLEEIELFKPSDINGGTYLNFAAKYDALVEPCPERDVYVSLAISTTVDGSGIDATDNATNHSLSIPKGYECVSAKLSGSFLLHGGEGRTHTTISVGPRDVEYPKFQTTLDHEFDFEGEDIVDELGVAIRTRDIDALGITVTARCVRQASVYQEWQNKTYTAIAEAYQNKVEAYNDAQPEVEEEIEANPEKVKFNPLFNRGIEKREIKRIAVDLMTKPFGINYARNNYGNSSKEVSKTEAFERHASLVKFFEQAFDWDTMAYTFYPYFYGEEDRWVDLFQSTDAADPIFQAFLQSGMARSVVPVRQGFEDAVNWFMATGEIWNGQGLIVDQDNEMFLSIADEMRQIGGKVEETWETRVPTALTIIQADGESTDNNGLPCFDEEHNHSA